MRLPRRSNQSIQAIPSIHTAFPIALKSQGSSATSQSPERFIEDGIEVVPLERSNTINEKIVSPYTDDKELVSASPLEKPLPGLPCTRQELAPRRRWERWSKRRRIIVIVLTQLILVAVITLALGLIFSPNSPVRRKQRENGSIQAADTQPPSPTDIPLILAGKFYFVLGTARQQSSACLAANNESIAWACADGKPFVINVTLSSGTGDISITRLKVTSAPMYGQQPLAVETTRLLPAPKEDEKRSQPMYSFTTTYNRTVLLPDSQFPNAADLTPIQDAYPRNMTAPAGSIPWLCFFNDTTVEGLIYLPKNTTNTTSTTQSALSLPDFPYILTLNERRSPNGTAPYCEQRVVLENGQLVSASTSKHTLQLSEPTTQIAAVNVSTEMNSLEEIQQTQMQNTCQCRWVYDQSNS